MTWFPESPLHKSDKALYDKASLQISLKTWKSKQLIAKGRALLARGARQPQQEPRLKK